MRVRRTPQRGSVSSSIILEDSKGWSQRNPRVAGTRERRGATRVGDGEGKGEAAVNRINLEECE